MPKDHDTYQPQEPAISVEQEPSGEIYFFPNDGGETAFSCKADSRREAEERNDEHLQHYQKAGN